MGRIRTIKPAFFASEDVTRLSLAARLTWIGLWTYVDDEGRGKAHPALVKAAVWPLDDDVTAESVMDILAELEEAGRIQRYTVDATEYLVITKWSDHQRINRATTSTFPPPPGMSTHGALSEPSVSTHARKGRGREVEREGEARYARPAPFCAKHPGGTDKPCRACGDARRASELWAAPTASPPVPPPLSEYHNAPRCDHGAEVGRCPICRRLKRTEEAHA